MIDLRCSHCGKSPNHEGAVPYLTLCSCEDGWFVPAEPVHESMRQSLGRCKIYWDDDRDRDGGLRSGLAEREMP